MEIFPSREKLGEGMRLIYSVLCIKAGLLRGREGTRREEDSGCQAETCL